MSTTKPALNHRQQKIRQILQVEKENGNDLTKKELMDKIRQILDQDYQTTQKLKEKELREEEIRRIRKLRMDGKITSEEEEYLTQSYQNSKQAVPAKEEIVMVDNYFLPNPVYSHRNKDPKKLKTDEVDSSRNNRKNSAIENKEYSEEINESKGSHEENMEEKEKGEKENLSEDVQSAEIETQEQKIESDENHDFQREKSELTLALENETSLNKLYELAEKMVFVSSRK